MQQGSKITCNEASCKAATQSTIWIHCLLSILTFKLISFLLINLNLRQVSETSTILGIPKISKNLFTIIFPKDPWSWYIYLHLPEKNPPFMVGKSTVRPMDPSWARVTRLKRIIFLNRSCTTTSTSLWLIYGAFLVKKVKFIGTFCVG